MNKKIYAISLSAVLLFSAGSAMAAYYSRGMMGTEINSNDNMVFQAQNPNAEKIQDYMAKLQNGQLSADEQKELSGIINTPPFMMGTASVIPAFGGQQYGYRMMQSPFSHMPGYGNQFVWYSLMCVITVILFWAVLLLSIVALYKWIKLSHHQK